MFAIEVLHPIEGWIRLSGRYSTKAMARGWYPFIRGAWYGCKLRTVEIEKTLLDTGAALVPPMEGERE